MNCDTHQKSLFLNSHLKDNLFASIHCHVYVLGPGSCGAWAGLEPARLCGFAVPTPVVSITRVMSISFQSNENSTFRGFQATVSFIHETGKRTEVPTLSLTLLMW